MVGMQTLMPYFDAPVLDYYWPIAVGKLAWACQMKEERLTIACLGT